MSFGLFYILKSWSPAFIIPLFIHNLDAAHPSWYWWRGGVPLGQVASSSQGYVYVQYQKVSSKLHFVHFYNLRVFTALSLTSIQFPTWYVNNASNVPLALPITSTLISVFLLKQCLLKECELNVSAPGKLRTWQLPWCPQRHSAGQCSL